MPELRIVPFGDAHVDAAAELLAGRHARHREAEPLLPEISDFRPHVEAAWQADGAAGVFAHRGGRPAAYLFGDPRRYGAGGTWVVAGSRAHALAGDSETMRDIYAAAAEIWLDAGHTRHGVYVPSFDAPLVDAWFRLSFGSSGALAMRSTGPEAPFEAAVTIRPGGPADLEDAVQLERALYDSMVPAPSFSGLEAPPPDELAARWRDTWDDRRFVHFIAERDGHVLGQIVMYKRPASLRVPQNAIDLAHAATDPSVRGSGVGRALTAHVLAWAHEAGYPVMTTEWRMTNLWASRFWPRRGFRPAFLRLYRSIP
jgi:GNAT superfamily N-acetyltransferase